MAAILLSEKYEVDLYGVLNCYDRVIISGNVHPLCYAKHLLNLSSRRAGGRG